jgi:phage/plasmid primase-like uncharacterized protein
MTAAYRAESAAQRTAREAHEARLRSELARDALQSLPPDLPRDHWVTAMTAALGEGIAEETVRGWSAQGAKYTARTFNSTWKSIQKAYPLGIGALVNLAKRYGYVVPAHLKRTREVSHASDRTVRRPVAKQVDQTDPARELFNRHEATRTADPHHPYLLKKNVLPHLARQDGNELLIGMFDCESAAFAGLQTIAPDGTKLFARGTRAAGSFCLFDWPEPLDASDPSCEAQPVLIAEGWATGAALYQCLPWCWVVAAFSANNLPRVALALARQYPHRPIVVCGDDDRRPDGSEREDGNVGRAAAMQAADHVSATTGRAFGHAFVLPVFSQAGRSGDFNDMANQEGRTAVADLVMFAVREAE